MADEFSLQVAAEVTHLTTIRGFVEKSALTLGGDPAAISHVITAVTEAVTNIILHGYRSRSGSIEIDVNRDRNTLLVHLRDQAPPFDPTTVPPPDLTVPLDKRPAGGLGVHLMRQLVDKMIYRLTPYGSNELILVKEDFAA